MGSVSDTCLFTLAGTYQQLQLLPRVGRELLVGICCPLSVAFCVRGLCCAAAFHATSDHAAGSSSCYLAGLCARTASGAFHLPAAVVAAQMLYCALGQCWGFKCCHVDRQSSEQVRLVLVCRQTFRACLASVL